MRSSRSRAPRSRRRARPRRTPSRLGPDPASKRRKPWHLELDGISITDLREISIGQSSLIGRGELSGGLELTVRGPLRFDMLALAFAEARLLRAGETLGRTSRSPSRHPHRRSSRAKTRCARSWAACRAKPPSPPTSRASPRSTSCSRSPSGCRSPAAAISRASSSCNDGVVEPGGHLDFDAETLAARIADWTVEGGGGDRAASARGRSAGGRRRRRLRAVRDPPRRARGGAHPR